MKKFLGNSSKMIGLLVLLFKACNLYSGTPDSLSFVKIILALDSDISYAQREYFNKKDKWLVEIEGVEKVIANTAGRKDRKYRQALERKLELLEEKEMLDAQMDLLQLKIRYRRGIDLIRLMYEKILGLDHHFSSLHTCQQIGVLSNPHNYPSFEKIQGLINKDKNKKYNMQLPALLQNNPFIAATYTMVSVLMGERGAKEKEKDMENIACILDFTVRMNADLNVIRNETEYLKNANQSLKEDCEKLFREYTRPIGYLVELNATRTNDDWGALFNKLEDHFREIEQTVKTNEKYSISTSRFLVDIEFATQRVIAFINNYSSFIGRGTQYYQKFDSIISNYQYEDVCAGEMPRQYGEMKLDIKATIQKFENTYDLPELQGSRLRDLMYGAGGGL